MNRTMFLLIFSICLAYTLRAQEKITVTSEAGKGKVFIYYQLQGDASKEYEVSVELKRTSQPRFSYSPEYLEGDYKEGKFATGKRRIIWKLTDQETKMFSEGDDFYFEVTARLAESTTAWYYYIGAALVAGGAAAAIVTWNQQGDSAGSQNSDQGLPAPPKRP